VSALGDIVAERAALVRERIARSGGRSVDIVAVTKGFGPEAIEAAWAAGLTRIGENYAQETVPKVRAAAEHGATPEVHFIGQLQTNKVKLLAPVVSVWETLDRVHLVDEVAKRAPGARVLVQVDATGEPGKGGCALAGLDDLVDRARAAELRVEGLMAVGPTDGEPAATRAAFRITRTALDRLGLSVCSMGMSGDLEIAVEEGATLVRVGTALFGARSHSH
jgi:hypothetical protein